MGALLSENRFELYNPKKPKSSVHRGTGTLTVISREIISSPSSYTVPTPVKTKTILANPTINTNEGNLPPQPEPIPQQMQEGEEQKPQQDYDDYFVHSDDEEEENEEIVQDPRYTESGESNNNTNNSNNNSDYNKYNHYSDNNTTNETDPTHLPFEPEHQHERESRNRAEMQKQREDETQQRIEQGHPQPLLPAHPIAAKEPQEQSQVLEQAKNPTLTKPVEHGTNPMDNKRDGIRVEDGSRNEITQDEDREKARQNYKIFATIHLTDLEIRVVQPMDGTMFVSIE